MTIEPIDTNLPVGIATIWTDGETRLVLRGEIDLAARDTLREHIDDVVVVGRRLILDLTDVTFLDSTGIAAIVGARQRGALVRVANSCHPVRRALEVSGLDQYIEVLDDNEPALGMDGTNQAS
jgi:anti-sigma B factor antagonist